MNATPKTLLALTLTPLLLSACITAPSYTPIQHYAVVPTPEAAAESPSEIELAVRELNYAQIYKLPIVYRGDPYTVSHRSYEQWSELPRDTVTRALRDTLAATGYFADVGDASDIAAPDLVLTGELRRFDEMRAGAERYALCEVRIELRNIKSRNAVWAKTYRSEMAIEGTSGVALAEAMSQAVTGIVEEAAADIVAAVKKSAQ